MTEAGRRGFRPADRARTWVYECMAAIGTIFILLLVAFVGIPPVVQAVSASVSASPACGSLADVSGPVSELGMFASGVLVAFAHVQPADRVWLLPPCDSPVPADLIAQKDRRAELELVIRTDVPGWELQNEPAAVSHALTRPGITISCIRTFDLLKID
jgi:hypothetical protein